ncbi:MAG: proteasome accessory factor [Ilumatobacteraceae bacterium]|nr:proteasome accessory factor [Ilumatobacteraceae bacterium]
MAADDGGRLVTTRRGPRRSEDRLRRLLVMLPWLMEQGEAPVAEMAARFELTEAELIGDLELAALCGLPPFIDEMIDVFIDEGVVFAGLPRLFTKPLRLTAPEAFSLLSAGRAAMQLPGADPDGSLARALAKLATVLGDDGVVVDVPQPPATADLAAAVGDNARLSVRYWSASRDEATEREITPRSIFLDRGDWYVIADDGRSGEVRTFRIDRFESWDRTGDIDPPAQGSTAITPPTGDRWFVDGDIPSVVLRLAAPARWAAERYPIREEHEEGDALIVRMAVVSEKWLRTLLLRLGPYAEVLEPAEWHDLGADAARELLPRYEVTAS